MSTTNRVSGKVLQDCYFAPIQFNLWIKGGSFYPSIHPSIDRSIDLSIYLSISFVLWTSGLAKPCSIEFKLV